MITVQEADKLISQNIIEYPPVQVPLQEAYGMVLREDLVADRDLPPFDRVMMDGIGINFSAWKEGVRSFPIEGVQKAGIPAQALKYPQACLEVMTGAVLPQGCDCVIPVEDIDIADGKAHLKKDLDLGSLQYVHRQGTDHASGDCLVEKGIALLAPQIAIAASIGKKEVLVSRGPKIAVVGTGDEVIPLGQKPEMHQIYQSNSYAMQSALRLRGYRDVDRFHLKDDKKELTLQLGGMLEHYDVIVLSGGVSMGKFDYIPEVLSGLGVEVIFHKVKERPGKPFWFGKSDAGKVVFGLPGNPVSTQVGLYRYVLPFLDKSSGLLEIPEEFVSLSEDVKIKTDLTYFLPIKVENRRDGSLSGSPVFPSGSGDHASLAESDGFVELSADTFHFPQGSAARFYRWKF